MGVALLVCGWVGVAVGVALLCGTVGVLLGVVLGECDKEMFFFFLEDGVLRAISSRRLSSRCRTPAIVGLSSATFQHSCIMSYL